MFLLKAFLKFFLLPFILIQQVFQHLLLNELPLYVFFLPIHVKMLF